MIRPTLLASGLATLVACGAGQSPSSIPSQDSVTIEGAINDAGVARLRQVITADTKTLVVNSPGGEIASAIALGSIVRERGLTVVVRGACLSACAHFVFAPATRRIVEPYAIIGFHGTATAREALLHASGRDDLAAEYAGLAGEEKHFYARAGLPAALLLVPMRKVVPICYTTDVPPRSAIRSAFMTRMSFFIPSAGTLRGMGVAFEGWWPASQQDLAAAVAANPNLRPLSFRLEDGPGAADAGAERVPSCGAGR